MGQRTRSIPGLLVPVLCAILALGSGSEPATGILEGLITDPQGSPLACAVVRITSESLGLEKRVLTDSSGTYRFVDLPPAEDYALEVSHAGGTLSTVTQDRIVVVAGETTKESIQLFDALTDSVVVSAKADSRRVVKLKAVGQRTEFSAEFLEGLPVLGRSYQDILTLSAGVVNPGASVLGVRAGNFRAPIDGVTNHVVSGGTYASNQYSDALEAVEVIQTGGSAALGRASGSFSRVTQVAPPQPSRREPAGNTEEYIHIDENPFFPAGYEPVSTFSIDVDTASYSNVRRFLRDGQRPPADAIRIEELINSFDYDDPEPGGEHPVAVNVEVNECPWMAGHRLVRIGLKGRSVAARQRPPANLVFLVDVSGSMDEPLKLPLVKRALGLLLGQLSGSDQVSLVTYADGARVVLPPTSAADGQTILEALAHLQAEGGTNGEGGLRLAYRVAGDEFLPGAVNRIILASDGDFNIGASGRGELKRLVKSQAEGGVLLTVLGFGTGDYKGSKLKTLAQRGNGNYAYIDSLMEARRVLVEAAGSTLVTIARDVKIQVEFNPLEVRAWRLIGYENRLLRRQDFDDDRKDAGEMGAGDSVTALYQVVPAGERAPVPPAGPLRYQERRQLSAASRSGELLSVGVRYKEPEGEISRLLLRTAVDEAAGPGSATPDFKFSAAVAGFGLILRDSEFRGDATLAGVFNLAQQGQGLDSGGARARFLELVSLAAGLGLE